MLCGWLISLLALYSGLPTPAFVTCSINAGEGHVKLSHMQWHVWTLGECVEECHIPRKTVSKWCATDHKHGPWNNWALNIRQSRWCFLGSESCFRATQRECVTPPHVHPTSRYIVARYQFYQVFQENKTFASCLPPHNYFPLMMNNAWCRMALHFRSYISTQGLFFS